MTDPEYFDVKIAGWWVWGLSMWIGGGWCSQSSQTRRMVNASRGLGIQSKEIREGHWRKRPMMKRGGVGVQRVSQRIDLNGSKGIHKTHHTRPNLQAGGDGVHAEDVAATQQRRPILARGQGVHRSIPCALEQKMGGLLQYFHALAERLRRVRVCCGDFERILGYSPTTAIGVTAVFLDPPYSSKADRDDDIYRTDDLDVAHRAAKWAIANGDNPLMRIALCGYEGEHDIPDTWSVVSWETQGGYANQSVAKGKKTRGQANKKRERIWFSPNCLNPSQSELSL